MTQCNKRTHHGGIRDVPVPPHGPPDKEPPDAIAHVHLTTKSLTGDGNHVLALGWQARARKFCVWAFSRTMDVIRFHFGAQGRPVMAMLETSSLITQVPFLLRHDEKRSWRGALHVLS